MSIYTIVYGMGVLGTMAYALSVFANNKREGITEQEDKANWHKFLIAMIIGGLCFGASFVGLTSWYMFFAYPCGVIAWVTFVGIFAHVFDLAE